MLQESQRHGDGVNCFSPEKKVTERIWGQTGAFGCVNALMSVWGPPERDAHVALLGNRVSLLPPSSDELPRGRVSPDSPTQGTKEWGEAARG